MAQKKNDYPYLERDISWMYFNRRILQEATRPHVPLLERLTFLGIYSNNLDEFFRVRVATQNRIAECIDKSAARDKEKAQKMIKKIGRLNSKYAQEYEQTVNNVIAELEKENIFIVNDQNVTPEQLAFIQSYYRKKLNGFIVPIWFSAVKTLDSETDENIYLAVKLQRTAPRAATDYAFLELPVSICGRFIQLPDNDGKSYLMYLDDVVRCCLPLVFEGLEFTTFEAYAFKFTRDAEMEIDNDLRAGTLQKIAKGVKSRKRGEPLRVIYDSAMPKDLMKKVLKKLDLDTLDTILGGGRYQNHKDFMTFPDCGRKDLKYPEWTPILKKELDGPKSLLGKIQDKDRFIHVPYHHFDSLIRVLQEAAVSKQVESIKITLYRLAKESKVVKALIGAARNGKKVTVVIELLARFDEESNIKWSKRMQEAGIEVVFGVEGLKVHSKLVYINCKGGDIACIGTGNFHEGNAKIYTDYMVMTARPTLVREVKKVFEFIRKPFKPVRFRELLVSPNDMKPRILRLIDNEIKNAKAGIDAWIRMKINHITDEDVVERLYDAAAAGVKIDIVLRGNCSLMPSNVDNMHVVGIIDRYLEHSRILIFANGGTPRYYMGSADWMPRNLVNRVEVLTPVYDEDLQRDLARTVDYGLRDTTNGRIVDGFGKNEMQQGEPFRSQEHLYVDYLKESQEYNNIRN